VLIERLEFATAIRPGRKWNGYLGGRGEEGRAVLSNQNAEEEIRAGGGEEKS